jgi:hypothetical protein
MSIRVRCEHVLALVNGCHHQGGFFVAQLHHDTLVFILVIDLQRVYKVVLSVPLCARKVHLLHEGHREGGVCCSHAHMTGCQMTDHSNNLWRTTSMSDSKQRKQRSDTGLVMATRRDLSCIAWIDEQNEDLSTQLSPPITLC